MLANVGIFTYRKYWGILFVEHYRKIYLHKIPRNTFMLSTMWRFIYTKYWGIVCEDLFTQNTEEHYVEHCRKIYLHKYWGILLCWALCEDLFTQNTEEYFVEHYVKIYLHKILRNTLLSTVGRFIYTKYW